MFTKHKSPMLSEDRIKSSAPPPLQIGFVICPVLCSASYDFRAMHAMYQLAYERAMVQARLRAARHPLSLGDPALN